ncbi:hypothetical protein PMIN04_005825 [Paraphaeosphaeria minitans]
MLRDAEYSEHHHEHARPPSLHLLGPRVSPYIQVRLPTYIYHSSLGHLPYLAESTASITTSLRTIYILMSPRAPTTVARRFIATATATHHPAPAFNPSRVAVPLIAAGAAATAATAVTASRAAPKLGRIARWYLPTMAAVAFGMLYIPETLFIEPSKRTVTLDQANRFIGMGVDQQLSDHNRRANLAYELTQEERNQAMLDSFGSRSSLDDMEKAIAGYEATRPKGPVEARMALENAYGDRSNLQHLKRAMQIYEVQ